MRSHLFTKWILLGAGVAAAVVLDRRRRHQRAQDLDRDLDRAGDLYLDAEPTVIPDSMDIDPADPVQGIDEVHEFHIEELGVDARSTADAAADLDLAATETWVDDEAAELDTPSQTTLDAIDAASEDVGDLYGVRIPPASDLDLPDSDEAFEDGENWIEALHATSTENGPVAEAEIVPEERARHRNART